MSKKGELSGYSWQEVYLIKDEDDPNRNRTWCKYYACDKENFCVYSENVCQGSTYCKHYEKRDKDAPKARTSKKHNYPVLPESRRKQLLEKSAQNKHRRKK